MRIVTSESRGNGGSSRPSGRPGQPASQLTIRNSPALSLVAICLLALGLRILGLSYGLPAVYNPDETPILNRALTFAKGDLNPHVFVYPTLYFYVLFIWEGLFFVAGRAIGLFDSLAAFQREFFLDPSRHFLAGRMLSVVCGTATVAGVYWLGRRLYDNATGLAAAAFLAVAPIAVRDAHYVKLDVPTTMAVVFALVALARIVVDPHAASRRRAWILAGLLAGLAVSTQYYAIFLGFSMIAVAAADLQRSRDPRETIPLFLWSVGAAALGFFIGTPFLLADLDKALADIAHVREVDIDRAVGKGGAFVAIVDYLKIFLLDAVGWPVWLLAVVGGVWAAVSDWRRGLVFVSFFLAFFAFIVNTVPMSRYLNVVLPIVALAAAFAVMRLARATGPAAGVVAPAAVVLAMIPGLIASIKTDLFIRQADTRTLAREFLERRVPAGSTLLIQPYSAPVWRSRESLVEAFRVNLGSESHASIKFQLMMALDPYPSPAYRLIYLGDDDGLDVDKIFVSPSRFDGEEGLAPLRAMGVDYVVLKQANVRNPGLDALDRALARDARLVAGFTPYRADVTVEQRATVPPFMHNTAARIDPVLERPGPIVEIWELK
jgi:hypothetical protein